MATVLMVAPEASPFAKSGGLADVMAELAPALRAQGEDIAVMIPRYRSAVSDADRCVADNLPVFLGKTEVRVAIYHIRHRDVPWYFVDCPPLFYRDGLYGTYGGDYPDNHIRFAVLSKAAIAFAQHMFRASIVHGHDWQSALVPLYLGELRQRDPSFAATKTVFTVHNLAYQGIFPESAVADVGIDPGLFNPEGIEFYGQMNMLKAGLLFSDAITTVSRTYANEIQTEEMGCGLQGVLRARRAALRGIVNGISYSDWNPETDGLLPAAYSADDLEGKRLCKRTLLDEMGLRAARETDLVVGMVSRLATQKGFDLLLEALPELFKENVFFAILGNGEPRIEQRLEMLAQSFPRQLAVKLSFDQALAHRITAGADVFLIPSRYEPCGLTQLYSLRYGTVPVVRAVGGLNDTVDESVGFKFEDSTVPALVRSVRRAKGIYQGNRAAWTELMRAGMRKDYSWNHTAAEYSRLYRELLTANPA